MNNNLKENLKAIRFFNIKRYINWRLKKENNNFKNYFSIALIIKNEAKYIQEWIEYHLLVGVDKFYIYDNESKDDLKKVLKPYIDQGIVEYIHFPGKHRQIYMCNDAIKRAEKESKWLALIDTDEFIVPLSEDSIPKILKRFEDSPGIEVNWLLYGSNGELKQREGLVIERFKTHSKPSFRVNRNVKTICNPRTVLQASIHVHKYFGNLKSVNTNHTKNKIPFLERESCFENIIINHYFTRSFEEFMNKRKSGVATHQNPNYRDEKTFINQDKNDIFDPIMDKYIPIIKKNILERNQVI